MRRPNRQFGYCSTKKSAASTAGIYTSSMQLSGYSEFCCRIGLKYQHLNPSYFNPIKGFRKVGLFCQRNVQSPYNIFIRDVI